LQLGLINIGEVEIWWPYIERLGSLQTATPVCSGHFSWPQGTAPFSKNEQKGLLAKRI